MGYKLIYVSILYIIVFLFSAFDTIGAELLDVLEKTAPENGGGYKYKIYLPKDYKENSKEWPFVLFLHGSHRRGSDLQRLNGTIPAKFMVKDGELQFIVVAPLCPKNENWECDSLDLFIDYLISDYPIDENRIYLTGISMGGFGTWELATAYPKRFAAIAPVCGGGDPDQAERLKDIPIWVFHGANDRVVSKRRYADPMVAAVRKHGGDVKYTVFKHTSHDIWRKVYTDYSLYEWFLEHERTD